MNVSSSNFQLSGAVGEQSTSSNTNQDSVALVHNQNQKERKIIKQYIILKFYPIRTSAVNVISLLQ